MQILAGDVGGTKTRLALFDADWFPESGPPPAPVREETYASGAYGGLEEIIREFLEPEGAAGESACFGVAGPVRNRRVETTNLPWVVEARRLEGDLSIARVKLLNDLEATARGIPFLPEENLLTLNEGAADAAGNQALIAAGTGLGEAGLWWDGTRHHPFASEGGHSSFAPGTEQEVDLLHYLSRRYGHVSWERVVSGPGLVNIYRFLLESRRAVEPDWLSEQIRSGDSAAAISAAAISGRSELCGDSLDLFLRLYGAEAGNLALKTLALGGVYVGGGIAPKIIRALRGPTFITAFRDKGRMGTMLEAMPVRVILDDRAAIFGAAAAAVEAA